MDADTLHHSIVLQDSPIGHGPHDYMVGCRGQPDETPEVVMRGLRVGKASYRVQFLLRRPWREIG